MNTVSSIASPATAFVSVTSQSGTNTGGAGAVAVAASPEPQISPQARVLAEFFEAASAFIQEEHFEPFTGWKYDKAGYVLNEKSAYLDVEKYNNYLFDKAATTLVEQAKQLGLALDKDEVLAQLKADNAGIAAIRFDNAERVKYLKMNASVGYSNLSRDEVNSLTDLYIAAKENGLDASQVGLVAFWLGGYNNDQNSKIIMLELYTIPGMFSFTAEELAAHEAERFARFQDVIDLAGELKAKLPNVTFGFDDERGFLANLLNPRASLGGSTSSVVGFLLQMADLYAPGATSGESWTWSPATGWTTDPDSPEANAARAKYEKWLEQTAEEYQQNFGDKAGKSARSPSETDRAEELEAALAKLEHEKKLLAQLLKPLTRPADTEDEARSPLARLDADDAIPAPDRPDPASRRSLDKRSAVRES